MRLPKPTRRSESPEPTPPRARRHDPLRWLDQHEARMVLRLEWAPALLDRHMGVLRRAVARATDYDFYAYWIHADHIESVDPDGWYAYWRRPTGTLRSLLRVVGRVLASASITTIRGYWVPTGWRTPVGEETMAGDVIASVEEGISHRGIGDINPAYPSEEDWFTWRIES